MTAVIKDIPTYPELGNIYEGDYFKDIPYEQYIQQVTLTEKSNQIFDICDFGAVAGKDHVNTEAFQAAADQCQKSGGGTVLVRNGGYIVGTVYLHSNTTLFIEEDSALIATRDCALLDKAMIRCMNASHVTVTGGGRIIGRGEWFVYEPKEKPLLTPLDTSMLPPRDAKDINDVEGTMRRYYRRRIRYAEDKYNEGLPPTARPDFMVWFEGCTDVTVENIILEDAMSWTLNLDSCNDVTVSHMVINNNRHVANTDGIDVTGSSNVTISRCFISTADDGIVLKNPAHTGRDMKNIHIKDCTILTVMNAFKIGTETKYDISDVVIEDCDFIFPDIYPGTVSGISIESADGSKVSNITARRIKMDQITCPLFIVLNMRNRYGVTYEETSKEDRPYGGTIEHIRIEDIKATNVEAPSIISGFEIMTEAGKLVKQPIKHVSIRNFDVTYRDNKEVVNVPETIEEYLYEYPENNNFGDVDACGIWSRHTEDLQMDLVEVTPRTVNTRPLVKSYDNTTLSSLIQAYINSDLRKRVQVDGGDMSFVSLEGNVVTVCVYADCAICTHVDCNLPWWIGKRLGQKFGKTLTVVLEKDVPYYYKK